MSFLSRLFRASTIENPGVPISTSNILSWLAGGYTNETAGVPVSEARVLGLPAYYRACAITAGTLAGLPIKVFKVGTREKVSRPTVLDKPNPRQTPFEFWQTMFLNGITWGNMFARKVRDGRGDVVQLWPIHPSRVRVAEITPTSSIPDGKVYILDGNERYTSDEIFHLPYLSCDGLAGVRPLELFRTSLGIAIAGDATAAAFYQNGSRIQGILTTDQKLDDEVADRIKARWQQVTGGVDNAGKITVLGSGAKFQAIALPPGDAQLLESRQWSVSEISRMVGVPPHLIGDVEKSTSWGTGIEEQVLGWVKFTLQGWITGNEQRIGLELIRSNEYAKTILEGLLRGDAQTRAALYKAGITDGWLNRNEVRELEDREPADGLDEFIVPSNMSIIAVDGHATPVAPPSTPVPPDQGVPQ